MTEKEQVEDPTNEQREAGAAIRCLVTNYGVDLPVEELVARKRKAIFVPAPQRNFSCGTSRRRPDVPLQGAVQRTTVSTRECVTGVRRQDVRQAGKRTARGRNERRREAAPRLHLDHRGSERGLQVRR